MVAEGKKVALVTGASKGIGAAIARRLGADGFTVVVNFAGDEKPARDVAQAIEKSGGRASTAQADVSNPDAVGRMFGEIEKSFGGLDVLVNNAGIMLLTSIAETDDATFDRQVSINFKGTFNTLREGARRLRRGGRIISLSSSVVGLLQPTYGVYAAIKAGVETMTSILAKELRGREICVNAVGPGPTSTDLFLNGKSQELVDRLTKAAPLERLGRPEDIASAVSFLAGPDGAWVNGQTLRVNGGII